MVEYRSKSPEGKMCCIQPHVKFTQAGQGLFAWRSANVVTGSGWVSEDHPGDRGRDLTPATAPLRECRARSANVGEDGQGPRMPDGNRR
jgi:hypothetical protein